MNIFQRLGTDLFQNKYGRYSLSRIIPAIWFVFLLYQLSVTFKDKDIPQAYYNLTVVFSSVYVGRAAVEKFREPTTPTNPNPTPTPTPEIPAPTVQITQ